VAQTSTGWRGVVHRHSTRVFGPGNLTTPMSWIGTERIAVGRLPTGLSWPTLLGEGVTHVVNCRARSQTWLSQDLAVERRLFGHTRVMHAPMWDSGRPQPSAVWSAAAAFAADALADPSAKVFIHCQQGRRRSVLLAYAVLRMRGYEPEAAVRLILSHRLEAEVVPAYQNSVEEWLRGRIG
jgi:protein-tyrosine phosphatase